VLHGGNCKSACVANSSLVALQFFIGRKHFFVGVLKSSGCGLVLCAHRLQLGAEVTYLARVIDCHFAGAREGLGGLSLSTDVLRRGEGCCASWKRR